MSKAKDAGASDAVLDYLKKQNRPYSVVDILNNLHKQFGKAALQKALDQLVDDGKVREKVYGKQKVYVVDQSNFPVTDESQLKQMESNILELNEKLKASQDQYKEQENQYSALNSALTTSEIEEQLAKYQKDVDELKNKLHQIKNNKVVISPAEKEKITKNHNKYVTAWKKRKRMATEMMDSILENYPADKKSFFEEVGLERDEDVGVTVPK